MIIYRSTMPEDYEHNNDSLFGAFIRDFTAPQSSVFSASTIIIPNLSVMNWLKDKIAQNLSICANIKFLTLNQYINNLYLANNSNVELLNFKDMKFIIYDYLSRCDLDRIEFLPIREYILSNTNEIDYFKTFQLAVQLEGVFDEYMYLRTVDFLNPKATSHIEPWQQIIWQYLIDSIAKQEDKKGYKTYLDVYQYFQSGSKILHTPSKLYIYGLNSIYPSQLDILNQITKFCDIKWYYYAVSQEYYGDLLSSKARDRLQRKILREPELSVADLYLIDGNSLVANLAQQSREFTELMLANNIDIEDLYPSDFNMRASTLLNLIQYDIRNIKQRIDIKKRLHPDMDCYEDPIILDDSITDNSIRINLCHNQMREVQVLFNTLGDLIAHNQDIKFSDILVVAPDINKYQAYIKAVFDNEFVVQQTNNSDTLSEFKLPYIVTGGVRNSKIIETLKRVLNIAYNLEVNEVLDILNQADIMDSLSLSVNDVETIEFWLRDNNTHFGYDAHDYESYGYKNFDIFSFKRFLINLVLGSCLPDDLAKDNSALAMYADINSTKEYAYYDNLENSQIELCNKLIKFIDFIVTLRDVLHSDAYTLRLVEVSEVIKLINLYKDVFAIDEVSGLLIDNLIAKLIACKLSQMVNLPIINMIIDEYFLNYNAKITFTGKITFTSMQSAKNIPYKIIYVLGMNLSEFPRSYDPNKLSILKDMWVIADRNTNLEDKQLFLDIILMAQQGLYFSYIGRNDTDNSELSPSVNLELFVKVLEESIVNGAEYLQKHIIKINSLHPFLDNRVIPLYSSFWSKLRTTDIFINKHWQFDKKDLLELSPEQLIRYKNITLKDLVNTFLYTNVNLYKVLGINTYRENDPITDSEDLSLMPSGLKQKVYSELISNLDNLTQFIDSGELYKYLSNKGVLSYEHIGEYQIDTLVKLYTAYQLIKGNIKVSVSFFSQKYNIKIIDNIYVNPEGVIVILDDFARINANSNPDGEVEELNVVAKKTSDISYLLRFKALIQLLFLRYGVIESVEVEGLSINKEMVLVYSNIHDQPKALKIKDGVDDRILWGEILNFYCYSLNNPTLIHKNAIQELANDASIQKVSSTFIASYVKNNDLEYIKQDGIWGNIYGEYFTLFQGMDNSLIRIANILKSLEQVPWNKFPRTSSLEQVININSQDLS